MIGKKINQLATELAPVSTDLTIIGDPDSGVSKKITLAQLGAIFSGAVSFYTDLASFPATGDINVIYCAKDTQKLYLWSGSAYTEVFPSQALLDTYQLRSEKGNANGYASLDSGGKVPISQLPSSIMEYKGTWNASTNTPTLANGTGDTGDVYICNVAGTVNFGAGAITFAVGDYVIYSGSIWQRSSGAVGTVTSVALTVGGDAISVSGSPLTTSGTLALAFSGTTSQYIRGNGTLANFPTSLVSGSGTANRLTKWSSTSGEIVNSNILDTGTTITNLNATADFFSCQFNGNPTTGRSYGVLIAAGSNSSDIAFRIEDVSSSSVYFYVWGDGRVQINNIPNATTDTDKFLVSDSGVIKYRTGAELLSDIGGASASGYVPYTGATANLDLGTHTLIAAKGTFSSSGSGDTVGITHSSGSGIALNITKGGNGEGLYINKTSGSGNAATIIGTLNATTLVKSGGTSSQFLKADGSVDSTSYGTGSVTSVGLSSATSGVTIGSTPITTSGTITLAIATASGSQQGLLSSTDWTTFNNKQNALTNPVTGTGTTNYLPKFTGASTIGNSQVFDNGTNVGIGTASVSGTYEKLAVAGGISIKDNTNAKFEIGRYNTTGAQNSYIKLGANSNSLRITNNTDIADILELTNSGNLGLGVTPSAWASGYKVAQYQGGFLGSDGTSYIYFGQNAYSDGTFKYLANGLATIYAQDAGKYIWYQAPSGTAGNAISFTQAMTLNASGNLSLGNTNDTYKLDVSGQARFTSQIISNSPGGGVNAASFYDRTGAIATAVDEYGTLIAYSGITNNNGNYSSGSSGTALVFRAGAVEQFRVSATNMLVAGSVTATQGNFINSASNFPLTIDNSTQGYVAQVFKSNNVTFGYIGNANTLNSGGSNTDMVIRSENALILSSASTERMRITSGGVLLFGTTTNTTGRLGTINIQSNGEFYSKGSSGGYFWEDRTNTANWGGLYMTSNTYFYFNGTSNIASINPATGIYTPLSDVNKKKDFEDSTIGLNAILGLKPTLYRMKSETGTEKHLGFIAQEVKNFIPQAYVENNGFIGLTEMPIVAALVKAIQELKQELDTLKNK
jgi:hypothetical protein